MEAIPACNGSDVLGSAPTGAGNRCFITCASSILLDYPRRKPGPPCILIITPTGTGFRVAEQAEELTEFTHLNIATITGGVAYQNPR